MNWVRGDSIGSGSFSTVNLAIARNSGLTSLMAVKSCKVIDSVLLENEKDVLDQIGFCKHIIRCFGSEESVENGERLFNLLLEYASGGNLARWANKNGGCLPESSVRRYTRSILKGLSFIHAKGFVHCDVKLQNLLLFDDGEVKIADFGLAKKAGERLERKEIRGTPLCLSPESVSENEYDPPCDIWAVGCCVVEMITGKPAWNCHLDTSVAGLLIKIGVGDELPGIPQELSEEGKDFLSKCFVKDPRRRWTADELLNHPFLANSDDELSSPSSSPRCPFEFQEWISLASSSPKSELWSTRKFESRTDWSSSPSDRIKPLASDKVCSWAFSGSWLTVR